MLRRSRYVPVLAVAACGLLAAGCSAPAGAGAATTPTQAAPGQARHSQVQPGRTLAPGATPQYTAVAFPGPASGWLLGQPGSGAARAEIWHSVTAGRTWQPQWQGAGDPLAVSATDPAHAWALVACPGSALKPDGTSCGRTLIGTTDAGLHWRVIARLPASVNQVQFFSGRLGVATSDRCLAVPSTARCPSQLLLSRDSGAHWTPVLAAPGPVFATAAAAGRMWAAEPAGSVISFLTSTDGGRHWRAVGRMTSPGPLSPDVRVGLAAGPPGSPGSPPLGLLYRSGPSVGDSASQRSLPALPPWQLTQVTSLDAVSGEVAYAIGGQDLLARTGDGGLHWTELRPAPAPTGLLDVLGPATALGAQDAGDASVAAPLLDFSDASHGWLVFDGVTWRTSDGGVSWT